MRTISSCVGDGGCWGRGKVLRVHRGFSSYARFSRHFVSTIMKFRSPSVKLHILGTNVFYYYFEQENTVFQSAKKFQLLKKVTKNLFLSKYFNKSLSPVVFLTYMAKLINGAVSCEHAGFERGTENAALLVSFMFV